MQEEYDALMKQQKLTLTLLPPGKSHWLQLGVSF